MPQQLKLQPDFSDYLIFGLSTHEKDFKLCWHINRLLHLCLTRCPSLKIPGDPELNFSLFVQEGAYEQVDLFLLSNFDRNIPWFAKAKHFYYFFIVRGNPLESQTKEIRKALKSIPQMLLVTSLSNEEKKLVLPLLTDFELHLTDTSKREKELMKKRIPRRAGIRKPE
jgi:hypothetical protein